MNYRDKYKFWVDSQYLDEESKLELLNLKVEKEIEDRFYKDLEFGTGGLRGIIGAGTNRMNVYTVGKTTEGLGEYLQEKYKEEQISVCIAYDSRHMSKEFAEFAAGVLCGNHIKVYLYESLRPTPMLSYTVRHLQCKAGIVITASHNPKQYNGYKVYGEDGGQVTDEAAREITAYINGILEFSEVKHMNLKAAEEARLFNFIGEEVDCTYYAKVKALTIREDMVRSHAKDLNIIYTPLHGTGNIPVRRVLRELGYKNVFVPKEQELPDGSFPTTDYPNPEESQVFDLAMKMSEQVNPDIIFGTDPDSDRIGVVVKTKEKEFKVLTGNQIGILLTHYIASTLKLENKLSSNSVLIKTIVTTEMAKVIASDYGVETVDVLTGFKYIGEKINEFEENSHKEYMFGFEESYGYLAGTFVRDKDAVSTAMLICEMTLYYKLQGLSLYDALIHLYEKYGYYTEKLVSIELKGKEGTQKIQKALHHLRHSMNYQIGDYKIVTKLDYKKGKEKNLVSITEKPIELPKSNVLKFVLEDGSWFVARPSGTEPKMKIYLSVIGKSLEDSDRKMKIFEKQVMIIVHDACDC